MGFIADYPYMRCAEHGRRELTYMICVHVLRKERSIEHVARAGERQHGEILCGRCWLDGSADGDLKQICAGHAEPHLERWRMAAL
jgi:hypothetical protein